MVQIANTVRNKAL